MNRLLLLVLCLAAASMVPASPTTWPATQPADLRKLVLGNDPQEATDALRRAATTRPAGDAELRGLALELLDADAKAIQKAAAAPIDPKRLADLEAELADLRKQARDNIRTLNLETIEMARIYHRQLVALRAKIHPIYATFDRILEAMRRRPMLREMAGGNLPPDEPALRPLAEKALGMSLEAAADAARLGLMANDIPPRPLALYRFSRRVEAYNRSMAHLMNRAEAANTRLVNEYREMLGLLPLEVDERLLQSARRHSKEMIDLKYHGHDSPTPQLRTPEMRMRAAGYDGWGMGENYALHYDAPDKAFWGWFNSPGHHRTMATAAYTSIGVGKWDDAWTQNYGMGTRLMSATEEQRNAARPTGPMLALQPDELARPVQRKITTTTEIRIYDPFNPDPTQRRSK